MDDKKFAEDGEEYGVVDPSEFVDGDDIDSLTVNEDGDPE